MIVNVDEMDKLTKEKREEAALSIFGADAKILQSGFFIQNMVRILHQRVQCRLCGNGLSKWQANVQKMN